MAEHELRRVQLIVACSAFLSFCVGLAFGLAFF